MPEFDCNVLGLVALAKATQCSKCQFLIEHKQNGLRSCTSAKQFGQVGEAYMRFWSIIAFLTVALSACTGSPDPTCYRIYESVVTENGARALMKVPCPPGRRGVLKDEELLTQ